MLGSILFREKNEIIKIVCGHILRVTNTNDLAVFFPEGTDSRFISEFPKASQDNKGWDAGFQDFLDKGFYRDIFPE